MIVNLNMILPVTFSFFYFNEKITVTKIIGVFLCLLALFLNMKRDNKKVSAKWIVYVFLAFFSTGAGISITQKIFARSQYSSQVEQFVCLGYITAFLITFVLVMFQKFGGIKFQTYRKKYFLCIYDCG